MANRGQGVRLDTDYLNELAGRARAIEEIANLPFEAMVNFYQTREEDGTETP